MIGSRGAHRRCGVALAGVCASAIGLAGAPAAAAVSQQTLIGAWSGPALDDAGDCGPTSAEYSFSPDGTYRYTAVSANCDAVIIDGHYELQADGGVLATSMDQCGQPGCPDGPAVRTVSITAAGPDSLVLDGRVTYRRMHD
jgi:hypothetical protein